MKNPPILVAVIGFFAAVAGVGYLFFGFSALGFDWFGALGDLQPFENVGLWGWLAIITGIAWLMVAFGLWALQPWARIFALVMAGIALLEAVLAFIQFPGSGVGFAMALMPLLLIWYLSSGAVKEAFGEGALATEPEPGAPEPDAAPEPVAASAPAPHRSPSRPPPRRPRPSRNRSPPPRRSPSRPLRPLGRLGSTPGTGRSSSHERDMRIVEVEGIGPVYAEKLAAVGITTTGELLHSGAKPHDRDRIAEGTGISSALILEWVNAVDLMRVPGSDRNTATCSRRPASTRRPSSPSGTRPIWPSPCRRSSPRGRTSSGASRAKPRSPAGSTRPGTLPKVVEH